MRNWKAPVMAAAAAVFLGAGTLAHGSILTFEITDSANYDLTENFPEGYDIDQTYGDRVAASSAVNGTVTFNYGLGAEGYTPNVVVEYGPGSILTGNPRLWRYDYGNLDRVLYQGSSILNGQGTDYDYLTITFRADAGYDAILYGFDLGGWMGDYTINSVSVYNYQFNGFFPTLNRVFYDPNALVAGPGSPTPTSYQFGTPVRANIVTILIDANNVPDPDNWNIGIDNIRFGQGIDEDPNSPVIEYPPSSVPEPGTVSMLAAGLAGLLWMRRRAH